MKAIFLALLLVVNPGQQPRPDSGRAGAVPQSTRQPRTSTSAGRAGPSISGKLLVDGQPLAGVKIAISAVGASANLMATMMGKVTVEETGDDGRFRFDGLRSTTYSFRPMLSGYIVESGLTEAGGEQTYYRPGDFASIRMVEGGVVTGRVLSESGSALVGVSVRAIRLRDLQGRHMREVTPWLLEEFEPVTTDDRGIYRIYGLEPGVYTVCAGGSVTPDGSGPFDNDSPVYHPGGPIASALEVVVRAGQESTGVDITYRELSGHSISGTLNGRIPGGMLFNGATIMLNGDATGALQAMRLGTNLNDGNRTFSFSGVPDGKYELTAIGGFMGDEITAAPPRKVVVDGSDVIGVDLALGPLAEVSGRVVLDAPLEAPPKRECAPKPTPIVGLSVITIRPAGDRIDRATPGPFLSRHDETVPDEKGDFRFRLFSSGKYYLRMKLPGDDLYVHAMTLPPTGDGRSDIRVADGADVRMGAKLSGITITLARGAASLAGRVTTAEGPDSRSTGASDAIAALRDRPSDKTMLTQGSSPKTSGNSRIDSPATARLPDRLQVIAVPAEPDAAMDVLRYATSPVQADGSFAFLNMAPGRYYLLTRNTPDEEWNNPGSLPDWYNTEQRKKLHRDAKKADLAVELNRCGAVRDYSLHYGSGLSSGPKNTN